MNSPQEETEKRRLRGVLSQRLTLALRDTGLNRESLAEILGVNINTVHAYAIGLRFPHLSHLTLLARALNVQIDWLLDQPNVPISLDLTTTDREILEYILVENQRGHYPTYVEISHAFDQEPFWAGRFIRKLVRFGFLVQAGGFRLSRSARDSIPDGDWRPHRKRRTPIQ